MKLVVFLLSALFSMSAVAVPVEWTLNGVTLDDGATLEGSFKWAADANQYSDIFITAPDHYWAPYSDSPLDPSDEPLYTFVVYNTAYFDGTILSAETWYDLGGIFDLSLEFASALTNEGGEVDVLQTSSEYGRFVISGTVTAVPIPAAAWLFGSALVGAGFLRRRTEAP